MPLVGSVGSGFSIHPFYHTSLPGRRLSPMPQLPAQLNENALPSLPQLILNFAYEQVPLLVLVLPAPLCLPPLRLPW